MTVLEKLDLKNVRGEGQDATATGVQANVIANPDPSFVCKGNKRSFCLSAIWK